MITRTKFKKLIVGCLFLVIFCALWYGKSAENNKLHMSSFLEGYPISPLRKLEIEYYYTHADGSKPDSGTVIFDDLESMRYLENQKYSAVPPYDDDLLHDRGERFFRGYLVFGDGTRVFAGIGFKYDHPHLLIAYPYDDLEFGVFYHLHLPIPISNPLASLFEKLRYGRFSASSDTSESR